MSAIPDPRNILPPEYFSRPAQLLARELLGAAILRRFAGEERRYVITETEAYLGPHDLACHSARGRTARTETMFGPPGTLYIYLVYGLHLMLNVVAGPAGTGSAVLIRSAGGVEGPGRLGKALSLSLALNGLEQGTAAGLWFEEGVKPRRILATPRIGIDFAGPQWAGRKLRFISVASKLPPRSRKKSAERKA
jgi:DNA-3-methyladenine glycosylase